MAATTEGAALTEAHRLAQARLAAEVAQLVLESWAVLDPENLDDTVNRWLRLLIPAIARRHANSARLAGTYLSAFRAAELGQVARFVPVLAPALPAPQIATTLTVTGPVRVKTATARRLPLDDAVDRAKASTARSAGRLVTSGGNDTIMRTVDADSTALGWARVTSGSPCAFCAMLASRGGVYQSERSASFETHDGCNCKPEPIYRTDARLPPGSERFAQMWREATRGVPAKGALNAFRRALAPD